MTAPFEPTFTPAEREEMFWLEIVLARAFRAKAEAKRRQAAEGTTSPEGFPNVLVRSGEAAVALRIAAAWDAIAGDLEAI